MKRNLQKLLLISIFFTPLTQYGVTLIGSDLLGPALEEKLSEYAASEGIKIEFKFDGTYESETKIINDEAEIALIAVLDESLLNKPELTYYPFAFQVMTLLVQANNPLTRLSYGDISSIFRMGGQFNNWGDLVDDPSWRSRKIGIGALDYEDSLAVEIFKSAVMPNSILKSGIRYFKTEQDMTRALSDDNTVIALYPSVKNDPFLKTLAVSVSESAQAYSPTVDNIYFGDYPFRLPYYIVYKTEATSPDVIKIIEFLFSKQIGLALTDARWVPLPDSERTRYRDGLK